MSDVQHGWVCPLCGIANAPWSPHCDCRKPRPQEYKQQGPLRMDITGSCPLVGCYIEGPHDHAIGGPYQESR